MSLPHDPADPDHHDGLLGRLDDFKERVEEAAIRAEFDTGEREETVEEAKTNALVRVARMTLGFIVLIIGIMAIPLPGPGWLIVAAGLTILAKDVAWADRLLRYVRKRVPGIPEDGKVPRSSLLTMAVITLAAASASLWWTLARGSDDIQAGNYEAVQLTEDGTSQDVSGDGVLITITDDGPVMVRSNTCDLSVEVVDRSKTEFVLDHPDVDCGTAIVDGVVLARAADGTVTWELGYDTNGIVEWFLADDRLVSLTGSDGTTLRLDAAG